MAELLIRPGRNDHVAIANLLIPEARATLASVRRPISRLVVDAHLALAYPQYREAAAEAGTPLIIDPRTDLLQVDTDPRVSWRKLPYASDVAWGERIVNPFDLAALVQATVDFQRCGGVLAAVGTLMCVLWAVAVPAQTIRRSMTSARVKMPTGIGSVRYRPAVFTISADGSWYFGGPTAHTLEPRRRSLSDLGRIPWRSYTATSAKARAVIWGLYGPGPLGADTKFENEGHIQLHAYRPVAGVFTRLWYRGRETIRTSDGRTLHFNVHGIAAAQESGRRWYW